MKRKIALTFTSNDSCFLFIFVSYFVIFYDIYILNEILVFHWKLGTKYSSIFKNEMVIFQRWWFSVICFCFLWKQHKSLYFENYRFRFLFSNYYLNSRFDLERFWRLWYPLFYDVLPYSENFISFLTTGEFRPLGRQRDADDSHILTVLIRNILLFINWLVRLECKIFHWFELLEC